jgi:hypothetical protein
VIEAGTVGAVFEIRNDASAALERLAREFNELQVSIDKIKESMAGIGSAEDGPIAKLREQFAQVGKAGEDASGIIMGAFGKVDGSIDGTIGRVNALRDSLAGAARRQRPLKSPAWAASAAAAAAARKATADAADSCTTWNSVAAALAISLAA